MKIFYCIGFVLFTLVFPPRSYGVTPQTQCNPKPLTDDLVIQGPQNTCFAFRPIRIKGKGPFAGQDFIMGDADSESFRTPPTKAMVGGSFSSGENDDIWIFYLGKYEITRKQYRAVMGKLPDALQEKVKSVADDDLPVTNVSYFEAVAFIDTLNKWFYANALDEMPMSGNYPGFVRLPSEIEWEFAARGGRAVKASEFESTIPYKEQLSKYEWFSGPKSSHNKLKSVGLLSPNPLGLHDMLGNAQEITSTQYQFEYYQGRSGGFTSRGNSFISAEKNFNVAQRQEEPYYIARRNQGILPNTKPNLGFRLVLSAPLLTGRNAIAEVEDAWEEYRAGAGSQSPAALSIKPPSLQEQISLQQALKRIEALSKDADASKALKQELAQTKVALQESLKIRAKADGDAAQTWLRQSVFWGQNLQLSISRLNRAEKVLAFIENEDILNKRKAQITQMKLNIADMLEAYRESIVAMHELPAKYIEEAFISRKKDELYKQEHEILSKEVVKESLEVLGVVKNSFAYFSKHKRANLKLWHEEFIEISKK